MPAALAAKYDCTYVACIYGDEPQIMPEIIDEVVGALLLDKNQNMTMACHEITGDRERIESPHAVKVVCDINGNALLFSRSPIPYPKYDAYYQAYESIGVFAFTKEFLMRYVTLPKTPLSQTEAIEELKVTEDGYPLKVIKTKFPYTPLHGAAEELAVGVYACSPKESSFTAAFSVPQFADCCWKKEE